MEAACDIAGRNSLIGRGTRGFGLDRACAEDKDNLDGQYYYYFLEKWKSYPVGKLNYIYKIARKPIQ
jgi:hypothetical protein